MAKINNVGLNLSQKIANPFKTSRNSTTNPFKYSNFEGNTLQFADVFEGFEPKKTNKLKMISASVAGSMTKLRSSITEPIINFVNRMKDGITSAWDYAKNTNVSDLAGIKAINNVMNADIVDIGKGITGSISNMSKGISEKMSSINMPSLHIDMSCMTKGLSDKWTALINNVHHKKISAETPVAELKELWLNQIALDASKESKVA